MKALTGPVARILYGLPLVVFGINHFRITGMLEGLVWLPGGAFWVYLTGIALILAALAFITKMYVVPAAYALAVFLLLTGLTVHLPSWIGGNAGSLSPMLKDLMLAGAALYFAGKFQEEQGDVTEAL